MSSGLHFFAGRTHSQIHPKISDSAITWRETTCFFAFVPQMIGKSMRKSTFEVSQEKKNLLHRSRKAE